MSAVHEQAQLLSRHRPAIIKALDEADSFAEFVAAIDRTKLAITNATLWGLWDGFTQTEKLSEECGSDYDHGYVTGNAMRTG